MSDNAASLDGETITINGVKYVRAVGSMINSTPDQLPLPCSTPASDETHENLAGCLEQMAIGDNSSQDQPQHINPEPRTDTGDGCIAWIDDVEDRISKDFNKNKTFYSNIVELRVGATEPYRRYYVHLPIALQLLKNKADWILGDDAFTIEPVLIADELKGLDLLLRYLYEKEQYGIIDFMTVQSWVYNDSVELSYLYEAASYFKLESVQLDVLPAIFFHRRADWSLMDAAIVYQSKYLDTTFRDYFKGTFIEELGRTLRNHNFYGPREILQVKKAMYDILSARSQLADDIFQGLFREFVREHRDIREWDGHVDLDDDARQISTEIHRLGQDTAREAENRADVRDLSDW